MAVVQISRIQHRRGRARTSPVPQLASGELGWAIDDQQLFIGNGAVSEGAPTVGNTRILTEKDDLLELAGQYAYKRDVSFLTGVDASTPVERTLQQKLDDHVSLFDFLSSAERSAIQSGSTIDITESFQRAIDQIFINSATKGSFVSRTELRVPAGDYLLSSAIYVPPFANIVGEGKGKTHFTVTGAHAFYTKNETSSPGVPADDSTTDTLNQARGIVLRDFTVLHESYGGTLRLESCRDSHFENIEFLGRWDTGDGVATDYTAIKLNALSSAVTSTNNVFLNCNFQGFVYPVYSDYDVSYNKFINGKIDICGYGFVLGSNTVIGAVGQATGPMHNTIENYNFENIDRQGIIIDNGKYNKSVNNKFIAVGNDGGNSANATYSIIRFGERGNYSENDYFERTQDLAPDLRTNVFNVITYPPEIQGPKNYKNNFEVVSSIGDALVQENFLQLPADQENGIIEIDYTYWAGLRNSGDSTETQTYVHRKGTLHIVYDYLTPETTFNDDYTVLGDPTKATDLEFFVTLEVPSQRIFIDVINTTGGDRDEFVFTARFIA